MKAFIFLNIILIILYLFGFIVPVLKKEKTDVDDWFMSRDYTVRMKGIAILTVFWGHGAAWSGVNNLQFIAGTGVAVFLILSGYGLERSYEKSGLKGFWTKRFIRVLLPFWIVELFHEILNKIFNIKEFIKKGFLLGEAGWYVIYILECYVIFYLIKIVWSFVSKKMVFKDDSKKENAEIMLFWGVFTVFLIYEIIKPAMGDITFLRSRQMYSFPLGILIAKYSEKIKEELSKKSAGYYALVTGAVGIIFMAITQFEPVKSNNYLMDLIYMPTVLPLGISLLMVAICLPAIIKNVFLYVCGMVSYEIFLVHSLFLKDISGNSVRSMALFVIKTAICASVLYVVTNPGKTVKNIKNIKNRSKEVI